MSKKSSKKQSQMPDATVIITPGGWYSDYEGKIFGGNWFDSSGEDEAFDPYQTKINYAEEEITEFYEESLREYKENEFYNALVNYLTSLLYADFEIFGEGAKDCKEFFDGQDSKVRDEIIMMGRDAIRYGTGGIKKAYSGEKLERIKSIDGSSIDLEEDQSPDLKKDSLKIKIGTFETKIEEWPCLEEGSGKDPKKTVAIHRLIRDSSTPYGIPIGLACFHIIKGLKGSNRDVLAALKSMTSNIKIVTVPMGDIAANDTVAARVRLESAVAPYSKMNSSTSGVVGVPQGVEMFYMGKGEGGKGSEGFNRLLKTMDFLEPLIAPLLMTFLLPVGFLLQGDANKSLISKQMVIIEPIQRMYRSTVARWIKSELVAERTKKEVQVSFKKRLTAEEYISLFASSGLSREKLQEELSIHDDGKTFVNMPDTAFKDGDTINKDDSAGEKRQGDDKRDRGAAE